MLGTCSYVCSQSQKTMCVRLLIEQTRKGKPVKTARLMAALGWHVNWQWMHGQAGYSGLAV